MCIRDRFTITMQNIDAYIDVATGQIVLKDNVVCDVHSKTTCVDVYGGIYVWKVDPTVMCDWHDYRYSFKGPVTILNYSNIRGRNVSYALVSAEKSKFTIKLSSNTEVCGYLVWRAILMIFHCL